MQLTFGEAEGLDQAKRTRKEIFLAEMEQVVPWKALLALIEPHYPTMGRPSGASGAEPARGHDCGCHDHCRTEFDEEQRWPA